ARCCSAQYHPQQHQCLADGKHDQAADGEAVTQIVALVLLEACLQGGGLCQLLAALGSLLAQPLPPLAAIQAPDALGRPTSDQLADPVGLGLALGATVVIVGLMKSGALEQTFTNLAGLTIGSLGGMQGDGCNGIVGVLALCPVDQLCQQEAAHAPLRREDAQALKGAETDPLVAAVHQ